MSSSRGGGSAPRRGRGGWSKYYVKPKRGHVKPDTEKHPLGELLKTVKSNDLAQVPPLVVEPAISNVHYVASYNWREGSDTRILVPGKPPLWTPLSHAHRLPEDDGVYYRDPNAAKFPTYPMAPVVQVALVMEPAIATSDVDIVACGSTLGNLLRFVRGQDKPFRFAVEAIGKSIFFVRKENDPKEIIEGVRGYGHTFPEAYTTWEHDVKGSDTHQRIIGYHFGSLSCLIRFECDGYLRDEAAAGSSNDGAPRRSTSHESDLLSSFAQTAVTHPPSTKTLPERVDIDRAGSKVSQEFIFDLKTRSGKYKADIDMADIFPQLWIKQVPNFIVAFHDGAGLFKDIRVQDVRSEVQKWEKDNADAIRRLAALLDKIVAFARQDEGLLEVYFPGGDGLEIRRQYGGGRSALPGDLRDAWAIQDKEELYLSDSDGGGQALGGESDSDDNLDADSDEEEPDYTACSAEDCGYCGKCSY